MKVTFTHKGWFFMCPVYLNAHEGDGMNVVARRPWLEWWFDTNEALHSGFCWLCDMLGIEYNEAYPFRVTGEIDKTFNFGE